jgi:hypothetical protein
MNLGVMAERGNWLIESELELFYYMAVVSVNMSVAIDYVIHLNRNYGKTY